MTPGPAPRACGAAPRRAAREGAPIRASVADMAGRTAFLQRMAGARPAGRHRGPVKGDAPVTPGRTASGPGSPGEPHDLTSDRFVAFDGGVPLWADYGEEERVVGGVGVSGGTVARDVACAEAGASVRSAGRASLSAPRTAGIRHD